MQGAESPARPLGCAVPCRVRVRRAGLRLAPRGSGRGAASSLPRCSGWPCPLPPALPSCPRPGAAFTCLETAFRLDALHRQMKLLGEDSPVSKLQVKLEPGTHCCQALLPPSTRSRQVPIPPGTPSRYPLPLGTRSRQVPLSPGTPARPCPGPCRRRPEGPHHPLLPLAVASLAGSLQRPGWVPPALGRPPLGSFSLPPPLAGSELWPP